SIFSVQTQRPYMDTEPGQWSESDEMEMSRSRSHPDRKVSAPAVALIVVGCLGLFGNFLMGLGMAAFSPNRGPAQRPPGMDDVAFESYARGGAAASLLFCCSCACPAVMIYPLVIVGGVRMLQLQNRTLGIVGSVMAMAPCSPVFLIGLPVGIWSLL